MVLVGRKDDDCLGKEPRENIWLILTQEIQLGSWEDRAKFTPRCPDSMIAGDLNGFYTCKVPREFQVY